MKHNQINTAGNQKWSANMQESTQMSELNFLALSSASQKQFVTSGLCWWERRICLPGAVKIVQRFYSWNGAVSLECREDSDCRVWNIPLTIEDEQIKKSEMLDGMYQIREREKEWK